MALDARGRAALLAVAIAVAGVTCGPFPGQGPAAPNAYDSELLPQLEQLHFQLYATPIEFGGHIFSGAGLDYDRTTLSLGYGDMVIDEWHATTFSPASGFCKPEVPAAPLGYCASVGTSGAGRAVYGLRAGGLQKYGSDFQSFFLLLADTGVSIQGIRRSFTLQDIYLVVDTLAIATPAQIISLNQQARGLADQLQKTAASRVDFKTYMPQRTIQNFELDKKFLGNPSDPLHPYVTLHFGRSAVGNQAFEFEVDEFRDDTPLTKAHCGFSNPEIQNTGARCTFLLTTPKGVDVYATLGETKFSLGTTRIVIWQDVNINQIRQDEMASFIDSFHEVPAGTFQGS